MWFVYIQVMQFEGHILVSNTIHKRGPYKITQYNVFKIAKCLRLEFLVGWYNVNMILLEKTVENLLHDEWYWNGNAYNRTTGGIYCFNNDKSFQVKLETLIKDF